MKSLLGSTSSASSSSTYSSSRRVNVYVHVCNELNEYTCTMVETIWYSGTMANHGNMGHVYHDTHWWEYHKSIRS